MKPNFFLIGAPKAATTSLAYLLDQHPQIFISKPKEPFFFSREEKWNLGWKWYESCFIGSEKALAIGDASTDYSLTDTYSECLDRISKYQPDARIIYILRDPLQLIESFWLEKLRSKETLLSFNKAVKKEPIFVESCLYYKHYNAYNNYFSSDKILILFFEDFIKNPNATLARVVSFLNLNSFSSFKDVKVSRNAIVSRSLEETAARPFVVRNLKRFPIVEDMYRKMPYSAKQLMRFFLKQPHGKRPVWNPKVRQWVIDQIVDDAQAILSHCNRSHNLWNLS